MCSSVKGVNTLLTSQGSLRTKSDIVRTKGQMVSVSGFAHRVVSAVADYSALPLPQEGSQDNVYTNGCGWIPRRLHLPKQEVAKFAPAAIIC